MALAVFILFGPFYRQVLGGDNRLFRQWQMYGGNGMGMVSFEFERKLDGEWQAFDYLETLRGSFEIPQHRPFKFKQVKMLGSINHQMCKSFGEYPLRLFARRADREQGWVVVADGEVVPCPWRR